MLDKWPTLYLLSVGVSGSLCPIRSSLVESQSHYIRVMWYKWVDGPFASKVKIRINLPYGAATSTQSNLMTTKNPPACDRFQPLTVTVTSCSHWAPLGYTIYSAFCTFAWFTQRSSCEISVSMSINLLTPDVMQLHNLHAQTKGTETQRTAVDNLIWSWYSVFQIILILIQLLLLLITIIMIIKVLVRNDLAFAAL